MNSRSSSSSPCLRAAFMRASSTVDDSAFCFASSRSFSSRCWSVILACSASSTFDLNSSRSVLSLSLSPRRFWISFHAFSGLNSSSDPHGGVGSDFCCGSPCPACGSGCCCESGVASSGMTALLGLLGCAANLGGLDSANAVAEQIWVVASHRCEHCGNVERLAGAAHLVGGLRVRAAPLELPLGCVPSADDLLGRAATARVCLEVARLLGIHRAAGREHRAERARVGVSDASVPAVTLASAVVDDAAATSEYLLLHDTFEVAHVGPVRHLGWHAAADALLEHHRAGVGQGSHRFCEVHLRPHHGGGLGALCLAERGHVPRGARLGDPEVASDDPRHGHLPRE